MVGRTLELEAGRRFLDAIAQGPGCLVLAGEAGIGKTTVWRETAALAEARGYRVLACRSAAAEAKLSYAGLGDLLWGLDNDVLERLPAPQRTALEVALLRAAPGQQPPEPRALFTAFSGVLSLLAEPAPLLVAIDDLQWLDRPSQAAVEFVLRRLGNRRIGFLTSVRHEGETEPSPGLARALEDARSQRVQLGPLSIADLHALIAARLGHPFARPILVKIATAARGNPFYALEIAWELSRRGDLPPGAALPVPDDLFELVSARIRRLPAATRDALLAAAALRDPVLELVDGAALENAEEIGLVQVAGNRVSFAHPLFASAVYASATARQRRRVHQRLAGSLADPEERARHLALAADAPSAEIAAALESAASQAGLRGSPQGAAELLELAVRLTPAERAGERESRAVAAAESYFHAGHLAHARSMAEQLRAEAAPGAARGNALRLLGEIRYHQDSFRDAIPLFDEALVELGDDPHRAEVRLNLALAHFALGSLKTASGHARTAVEEATGAGDRGLYAAALAMSAACDFFLGRPLDRDRMELALAHEDPGRQMVMPMRPSAMAGSVACINDDLDRAAELLRLLRERTIERGEDSDLPFLSPYLSYIERHRGNLRAALALADEGYEIGRTLGTHTALALILAERCFGRATLGEVEAARADGAEAQRLLGQVEFLHAYFWVNSALRFLELSVGNVAAPNELLDGLAAAVEARGRFDPLAAAVLADTIEAHIARGELERAEALATLLEEYGRAHAQISAVAASARCRALVLAVRGDLAAALTAAEEALAEYGRTDRPIELGRALLIKGQIERRAKRKAAARASLERSLAIFEGIGARLWAAKAEAELGRTGARHSGSGELTPSELRVAELAGRGLTMKQIAETVFLSPKTVEANLTRIYSKLGIRSRAELGRVMAEREQAAAT